MANSWPNGWETAPLADISESSVDGPFGSNLKSEHYVAEPGVRVVRLQNIDSGRFNDADKAWVSEAHAKRLVRHAVWPNDVLVASLGDENHPCARACLYPANQPPGIVKADCFRLRIGGDRALPGWVMRALNSQVVRKSLGRFAQGVTRDRVNLGNLLRCAVPLPPFAEQQLIAEILNSVDNAVEKAEQLITKLKQIRQGLLHDLLTFGVDESGETRDFERHPGCFKKTALGWIPASWELSSVEGEFDVALGIALGPHRRPKRNKRPYLRVANVYRDVLDLADIAEMEVLPGEMRGRQLSPGDLLVVEGHADPTEIGRCAMASGAVSGFLFQNHLFRLRARRLDPGFGLRWMNSVYAQAYWMRVCSTSSGLNTINSAKLRRLPVLVPPQEEQKRIVERVHAIERRISTEEASLAKLCSIRQGLAEDLLTGRVPVTNLLSESPK